MGRKYPFFLAVFYKTFSYLRLSQKILIIRREVRGFPLEAFRMEILRQPLKY